MFFYIFLTLIVVAVRCVPYNVNMNINMDPHIERQFRTYLGLYNKHYSSSEYGMRLRAFADNFRLIKEHKELYKQGLSTFDVGVNEFADRTKEELNAMCNCDTLSSDFPEDFSDASVYTPPRLMKVPKYWNWTDHGAVTQVKNQGHCGSCYAFSGIGAIESHYIIKTGKKRELSEQNIVDCGMNNSHHYDLHGCHGGAKQDVFRYVRDNGVLSQQSYPYTAKEGKCWYNQKKVVVRLKTYASVKKGENNLKKAIYRYGPVSVSMVCTDVMKFYNGVGIFYDPECEGNTKTNHALLAVGYGTTASGADYWIVKNSWGQKWGRQGYLILARNKRNHCEIASKLYFPIIL